MSESLRAPFSYFGNKRQIAQTVLERLGAIDTYIEPFFGVGAVYFARQNPSGLEIINDKEGLLINAFRAIKYNPDKTAALVAWPPSELDIIARHRWLMEVGRPKLEELRLNPDHFDVEIAARYIWLMACYVGGGCCSGDSYKNQQLKIPKVSGEGVFRTELDGDLSKILEYFKTISYRMRNTKIACGDWERVVTPIWTSADTVGIFADPPYDDSEHSIQYSAGGGVAQSVRRWAIENGRNSNMRIVIAGYESDDYRFPDDWSIIEWKASGGYANQSSNGKGRENAKRERLWCSPSCVSSSLFHFLNEGDSPVHVTVESHTNQPSKPIDLLLKEMAGVEERLPVKPMEGTYSQSSLFDMLGD